MLSRTAAVLVIIDIQGNLAKDMFDKENIFANTIKMIKDSKRWACRLSLRNKNAAEAG